MTERPMPIGVGRPSPGADPLEPLPWAIIAPHERQAEINHGQTLARLRERGGLSPCEAVAILEDRRWQRMDQTAAIERLAEIVKEFVQ